MRSRTKFSNRNAGFVEVLVVAILIVLMLLLSSAMLFNRSAYQLAESSDRLRQGAVERVSLEQATKDSLLAKLEVAPANSAASLDALLDGWCANYNSTAHGITITRGAASPLIAGLAPAMFPAATVPYVLPPNLITAGDTFQTKDIISRGAVANGGTLAFTFAKTIASNMAENRSYTVNAQLWSVPMTNWTLIAYGMPARATVPSAAPSGASGVLSASSFTGGGGRGGILTTLRPSPAYSYGDPTAFDLLYKPPASGAPERLPAYYTTQKSIFWNAWEFIWSGGNWPLSSYASGYYQDRLLYYATRTTRTSGASRATTAVTDLAGFDPPTQTGVTRVGTTTTIDLGTYPEDILYLVDGLGGTTVNITGAATNALGPLVLVLANQGTIRTTVNFSGANYRTVLVYSRNCSNNFTSGTTFNGGVYLDSKSLVAGTLSLTGVFAFYGAGTNPFPGLTLALTPPTGGLLTDLQAIAPRVLVVSTTSVLND